MMGWIGGIQNAIEYIEDNLTEELSIQDIAEKACLSAFYFQRIFSTLCGFTVGEYIRNRRLSLAAQEISKSDAKVIDVALKYGYCSPDSFTRAFAKFQNFSLGCKIEGCKSEVVCTRQNKADTGVVVRCWSTKLLKRISLLLWVK